MLGNKKYTINSYTPIDYLTLEEIFEEKARKGYLVDNHKFGIIRYIKTEPLDLDFSIGVYPKSRAYEGVDDLESGVYIKAQEEKGWTHAVSISNMQVFYKEKNLDIPSIDKTYQIENIRSSLKLETISYLILGVLNLFNMRRLFPLEISNFYSNTGILGILILPIITFFLLYNGIENIVNLVRLKRQSGEDDISYRNHTLVKIKRRVFNFVGWFVLATLLITLLLDSRVEESLVFLTLLPIGVAFLIGFSLRAFFKGRDYDPFLKTFIMIILVFIAVFGTSSWTMRFYSGSQENRLTPEDVFGLTFEDLGYIIDANHSEYYDARGSILMPTYYTYYEYIGNQRLGTEVMVGKNENLTDYFLGKKLERMTSYYSEYWDAKEFYPAYEHAYFITNEEGETKEGGRLVIKEKNSIVIFTLDKDLSHEGIIAIINEKMKEIPENW